MEDLECIVIKAKENDEKAFKYLINYYKKYSYYLSKNVFLIGFDIEDILRVCEYSIFYSVKKYKIGTGTFDAYCKKCMRTNINLFIRINCKHNNAVSYEDYDSSIEDISYIDLYSALEVLNDKEKDLINLVYFKNYRLVEVQKLRGYSHSYASKIKKNAIEKLKKYLNK